MRYKLGCVAVCAIVVWQLGHSARPPFTPNFYCDHGYLRENADVCQDRLNRPAPLDECVNCFEYRNSIVGQTPYKTARKPANTGIGLAPLHIAIVVPYRNREGHRGVFEMHMKRYFENHFPNDVFHLWIVEQANDEAFNRAWLANVGFTEAMKFRKDWRCVVFHDIDLVPQPGVPYTECPLPIQLGSELQHFNWGVPYATFAGGIVSMAPKHWNQINGYSNDYVGWGGEDDDLYHRLRLNKLLGGKNHIVRPSKGTGRFNTIDESKAAHTGVRPFGPRGTGVTAAYNR